LGAGRRQLPPATDRIPQAHPLLKLKEHHFNRLYGHKSADLHQAQFEL
jgi:hypothetical protein